LTPVPAGEGWWDTDSPYLKKALVAHSAI